MCLQYKFFENTVGKGETRNFSFSLSVFYPFGELSAIFIQFEIVICKHFQIWRVLNLLFGKELTQRIPTTVKYIIHNPNFSWPWERKLFKILWEKGENAGNRYFLHFPRFLPFSKQISIFGNCIFCPLQMLSISTSLKFCCLVKN